MIREWLTFESSMLHPDLLSQRQATCSQNLEKEPVTSHESRVRRPGGRLRDRYASCARYLTRTRRSRGDPRGVHARFIALQAPPSERPAREGTVMRSAFRVAQALFASTLICGTAAAQKVDYDFRGADFAQLKAYAVKEGATSENALVNDRIV